MEDKNKSLENNNVEVSKDFLNELITFVKDSALEGNSFAVHLIKKYELE